MIIKQKIPKLRLIKTIRENQSRTKAQILCIKNKYLTQAVDNEKFN